MGWNKRAFLLFLTFIMLCINFGGICVFADTANNFSAQSVTPKNNSTLKQVPEEIVFTFSKEIEINKESLFLDIMLYDENDNQVEIETNISGKTLTIEILSDLYPNLKYTALIPAGALRYKDSSNYVNSQVISTFKVQAESFTYSQASPKNKATNVALDTKYVYFTFKYDISINDESLFSKIYVRDRSGKIVSTGGEIVNNILQFKITQQLAPYTTYYVNIPKNTLKFDYEKAKSDFMVNSEINLSFTTVSDSTKPKVISDSANGYIDVNSTITVRYDKQIKLAKDKNKITLTKSNGAKVAVDVYVSESGNELVIVPQNRLDQKSSYTLYIPNTAVYDIYMNHPSSNYTMKFQTGIDLTGPKIMGASIPEGEKNVPIGTSEIKVRFDEKIKYSANFRDIALEGPKGKVSVKNRVSGDTLIIEIQSVLEEGSPYTLSIPPDAVMDEEGNRFTEGFLLSFTTYDSGGEGPISITSIDKQDPMEIDAGISFEDAANFLLPYEVGVTLSDKSRTTLPVVWESSSPAYNPQNPANYTIKGKLVLRDNIVLSKQLIPTIVVTVIDREAPVFPDTKITFSNTTDTSTRLIFTEAEDDSQIKDYTIEFKVAGQVKKSAKVNYTKLSRMSDDINNPNYNKLYYDMTGLTPSTNYTVQIWAQDIKNNKSLYPAEGNVRTSAKAGTSSGRTSSNTQNPSRNTKNDDEDDYEDDYDDFYRVRFADLDGYEWAREAILYLADEGIIKGTSENTFSPGANITRADLTVLITRLFNIKNSTTDNFSDVDKNAYYAPMVGGAKKAGIVLGGLNNTFNPKGFITREDMFVIIVRAIDLQGYKFEKRADISTFYDFTSVSDYAQDAVSRLVGAGIVKGDNNYLRPKSYATRAEVAVLLKAIIDKVLN
ncbi:MAG: hypothetical protein GX196_00915 [Clostridiaceae bacterium]|nr:hypothetical protein [Clostridiaceae bacterium]